MCGIFGILTLGKKTDNLELITNMEKSLIHRGPDDGGIYIDESVILGHRRLSIIDLDSGHQPIFN